MVSGIIFGISLFLTFYYLPLVIFKGIHGFYMSWLTLVPFSLGVTGIVLFICGIY